MSDTKQSFFSNEDAKLIKAFLKREARDYGKFTCQGPDNLVMNQEGSEYVEGTFDEIELRVSAFNQKYDMLTIQSLSNMGLVIRELKISSRKGFYNDRYDFEVTLCPCGKPDHSVHVNMVDKS